MRLRLALVLLCLAQVCLAAYKPSIVEGPLVRNPSVGFHGFSVSFPTDYVHYPVGPATDLKAASYANSVRRMATDYDTVAVGLHTNEIVVFEQKGRMALALGIATMMVADDFSLLTDFERTAALKREANFLKFTTGEVLVRTTEKAGDRLVAKVVRTYNQGKSVYVNAVYISFGDVKDVYTLNGISSLAGKEKLLKDMDAVMASLVTGKPKKK